jgi:hypothetical protein
MVTQPGAYTMTEEDRVGWAHQGATNTVIIDAGVAVS